MEIAIWCLGIYLVIGVLVTFVLSQTPYADNAWWLTTLLWPLFVWAFIFN